MLGTLPEKKKQHWSQYISAGVHAYNSIENVAMGYCPYMLMIWREAELPVDLAFGTSSDKTSITTHGGYVDRLRKNQKRAYKTA